VKKFAIKIKYFPRNGSFCGVNFLTVAVFVGNAVSAASQLMLVL